VKKRWVKLNQWKPWKNQKIEGSCQNKKDPGTKREKPQRGGEGLGMIYSRTLKKAIYRGLKVGKKKATKEGNKLKPWGGKG